MGEGLLPYKRLMGCAAGCESHFHDWIDYNGVAHFRIFGDMTLVIHICTVSKRTRMFAL